MKGAHSHAVLSTVLAHPSHSKQGCFFGAAAPQLPKWIEGHEVVTDLQEYWLTSHLWLLYLLHPFGVLEVPCMLQSITPTHPSSFHWLYRQEVANYQRRATESLSVSLLFFSRDGRNLHLMTVSLYCERKTALDIRQILCCQIGTPQRAARQHGFLCGVECDCAKLLPVADK